MAGGGTGGHVYPAIAIADAVTALRPNARVVFVGTADRLEARAVPDAGYALHPISAQGIRRNLSLRNLTMPIQMTRGLLQSWRIVGAINPDVAVGTGGYVAAPALLAAWLRGRSLLVQEQNAYAGLTNRLLSRLAQRVHVAFPEATDWVPSDRAVVSGNPTRRSLREAKPKQARSALDLPTDAHVLLIFGGTLGSEALNEAVERALPELLARDDLHVMWQTGTRYYEDLNERVEEHPRLHLVEYIDRMDRAYAAADLAVCRAGAITCSELLVTGTPAVLVPSPNVTANHQTRNAKSMDQNGAARHLPERELRNRLTDEVLDLMDDEARRTEMSRAARRMARPQAAETIARDVLALADESRT